MDKTDKILGFASAVILLAVPIGLKVFNKVVERQNMEMYENIVSMAGGKDSLMMILGIDDEGKKEEVISPESKYLLLHDKQADIWTAEMYKNNKESMKGLHRELAIFLMEDHMRLGAIDTASYYLLRLQGEYRIWNGKKFLINASHVYSEFPSALVRKLTPVYGELSEESQNTAIKVYTHPTYN